MQKCFRSKWALTRGSDRLRDGFFYFCLPNTPCYPGVHNLWSRNWTSGERGLLPILGEDTGPRQAYGGDPPARVPLPVLVGTADCIRNGEKAGLAIVQDVSAFCGKILPDPCYLGEDDLLAKTNVEDCVFAHVTARIIDEAYDDLAAAASLVQDFLGPDATVTTFDQPNEFIPAGVIGVVNTTAVVWLTGTSNFNQLAVQAFYFGTGSVNQGAYSASLLYEAAALFVADELNAVGAGMATRVVLNGHSYGGAVCMVLAAKMRVANPTRKVELLTLGAPKPGDHRLIELIRTLRQTHYVNERDPIPQLPPRGVTFAALFGIINAALEFIWPSFARPTRLKMITRDGLFIDIFGEQLPDDLIFALALMIGQGFDVPRFRAHSLPWYIYYLCQACMCVPGPCVAPEENDLAFEVKIEGYEYTRNGLPFTNNVPRVPLAVFERYASGKAKSWLFGAHGEDAIFIVSAVDLDDNYTDFTVTFQPGAFEFDCGCLWAFTADEMLQGIATTEFPSIFINFLETDALISLGGLFIYPTLV